VLLAAINNNNKQNNNNSNDNSNLMCSSYVKEPFCRSSVSNPVL